AAYSERTTLSLHDASSDLGVHNLTAVFTPTDATNYSGATATATVTVTAAPVTLTWTPATPLVYGTTLALTAVASPAVPGAVRYYEGTTELTAATRSEERRVGKECRSRWWAYH